jgi:hypothetical protein
MNWFYGTFYKRIEMEKFNENDIYTMSSLRDELNKKFSKKKTGQSFTVTDVEAYVSRGYLPKYMGYNIIEEVLNPIKSNYKVYKVLNEKYQ